MKVAFYKGKDHVFNRLTSWWTRGPYSHTELLIEDKVHGGYFCYSSSFMDGGVRMMKMKELNPDHWDIVDVSDFDQEAAIEWFEAHLGLKYDLAGLFGFVFRALPDNRNKFFCSEAVAKALGFNETWRLDPNTFYAVLTSI